jgi:hypothetical protein
MINKIVCCLLLSLLSFANSLQGQDRRVIRGFTFQTENDVFAGMLKSLGADFRNLDKDYSGGFRFEFYTDYLRQGIFPLFRNRSEDPQSPGPHKLNANSLYLHGMGFTPNRYAFALLTPDRTQRPYSSIFGIGWKRAALFVEKNKMPKSVVSDFFIGKVGVKLPGDFQNFIHEYITNSDLVMGWENQIGNGGRWAFNYRVLSNLYVDEVTSIPFLKKSYWVVSPQATIGNIFINGGAKISFTNQRVATMSTVSAMPSVELADAQTEAQEDFSDLAHNRVKYEIYARALYVHWNTLLMGMPYYDNSAYVVNRREVNRALFDIGAKLIVLYKPDAHKLRRNFAFFELVYRTREFSYGHPHVFGNLGFTIMSTSTQ